ncbi:MAG: hydrogenase maturation protease [Rhodothermales bacterium]
MAAIKIIGIGNPYRRDDAAGLEAVRQIRRLGLPGIDFEEASGEGADLMDRWAGREYVILIDAVRSNAVAGTLHRLDASRQPIPQRFFSYSTHAFSVAEAVELARTLGRLPRELIIFGIEGLDFSAGEGLTPAVEKALEKLVEAVRNGEWAAPILPL